ncbi:MAG: hypothetical protein HKM93_17565 [Desulfobacteraceae bacterium]|nr:hypothetical protein [Desulfobacteraceae bacterium]
MHQKENDKNNGPFARLAHVSVVVDDIEKAVHYYESLGVGPFAPPSNHEFSAGFYLEKPLNSKLTIREADIGGITLQLVEHLEGDCVAKDYLDRKGTGVYHLGFKVDSVDYAERTLIESGVGVLQKGRRMDNSGYTYFDTEAQAGVTLEIKQVPEKDEDRESKGA